MCLIAFSYDFHRHYPLIIIAKSSQIIAGSPDLIADSYDIIACYEHIIALSIYSEKPPPIFSRMGVLRLIVSYIVEYARSFQRTNASQIHFRIKIPCYRNGHVLTSNVVSASNLLLLPRFLPSAQFYYQ